MTVKLINWMLRGTGALRSRAFVVGAILGLVVLLFLWTATLPKIPGLFTLYRVLGAPTRLLGWLLDPIVVQIAPGGEAEHLGPAYLLLVLASALSMAVSYGTLCMALVYAYRSFRGREVD